MTTKTKSPEHTSSNKVKVNFKNTNLKRGFDPIPEGIYEVLVENVRYDKDKDYAEWHLVILDGPYKNRKLWLYTSLQKSAKWKFQQWLEYILEENLDDKEVEYDLNDFLGVVKKVKVRHIPNKVRDNGITEDVVIPTIA